MAAFHDFWVVGFFGIENYIFCKIIGKDAQKPCVYMAESSCFHAQNTISN